MRYVLDASSVLRYTDNEAGADRIEEILRQAARGQAEIMLTAVNWGEVANVLYRRLGPLSARPVLQNLKSLPIAIVPVDAAIAEAAGIFKADHKVPYADAYAGAVTLAYSSGPKKDHAVLVTADFDFKNVASGTIQIEFLPKK